MLESACEIPFSLLEHSCYNNVALSCSTLRLYRIERVVKNGRDRGRTRGRCKLLGAASSRLNSVHDGYSRDESCGNTSPARHKRRKTGG